MRASGKGAVSSRSHWRSYSIIDVYWRCDLKLRRSGKRRCAYRHNLEACFLVVQSGAIEEMVVERKCGASRFGQMGCLRHKRQRNVFFIL